MMPNLSICAGCIVVYDNLFSQQSFVVEDFCSFVEIVAEFLSLNLFHMNERMVCIGVC